MTGEIVNAILQIFGVLAIGWFARHKEYIREEELDRWSRFVVDFLMPLLIFHSISRDFEPERIAELWPLPLLGFGLMAFGGVAGVLLVRAVRHHGPDLAKTFHHFCAINNYGFLPIIIVQNLMGEKAMALLFFFNLGSSLGLWTIGVGLLGDGGMRKTMRNILSPSLIAIFLALGLSFSGVSKLMPAVIFKISGYAGAAAIPSMVLLAGAAIYPLPRMQPLGALAYVSFVRLLLLPAACILVILMLPLARDVRIIALVVALMPAPVSSTVLTRRFGGDPVFAVRAVVLTTILSLITVPLGIWLAVPEERAPSAAKVEQTAQPPTSSSAEQTPANKDNAQPHSEPPDQSKNSDISELRLCGKSVEISI